MGKRERAQKLFYKSQCQELCLARNNDLPYLFIQSYKIHETNPRQETSNLHDALLKGSVSQELWDDGDTGYVDEASRSDG